MSRDLTSEEKKTFYEYYGEGASCKNCANPEVVIKIWEKYGSDANEINGDISPNGIIAAVIVCENCGHSQTVAREKLLEAG